jgi:hypothetical protein
MIYFLLILIATLAILFFLLYKLVEKDAKSVHANVARNIEIYMKIISILDVLENRIKSLEKRGGIKNYE